MKRMFKLFVGSALAFSTVGGVGSLRAGDELKNSSLRLVPKDADVYWASWRQAEQWQRLVNGPVAKKLVALPAVQKAWKEFLKEWDDRSEQLAQARMVWDNPNFKEALAFLGELGSEETFFFGDKNLSRFITTVNEFTTDIQVAILEAQDDTEEAYVELIDKWIGELEKTKLPTIVFGAKFQDEDLATTKVDQLEALIQLPLMAAGQPQFQNLIKRVDDSRGSRVSITLNGKLIPWDAVPTTDEFDEEALENLREVLEEKNITLTVGMLDKFFVVALSETTKDLLELGKGESLLAHPDFAPVVAMSDKPLTMASYTSNVFGEANWNAQFKGFFSKLFSQTAAAGRLALDEESEAHDLLDDIESDVEWMDTEIAKVIPPFQGQTMLSFLTDDGWEMLQYNRTPDFILQSEEPLQGLQHVGGKPLMMVVTRFANHPEYFQLMRKIVQRVKTRLDEALEMDLSDIDIDDNDQVEAKQMIDRVYPLLEKVANTYETLIAPSLTGEHGLVWTSGNLKAKQWVQGMPESEEPLPLPEFSWISGLKDRDSMIKGGKEIYSVFDSILELARELDPNSVPEGYSIPRPEKVTEKSGIKYGYPIPEDCPVPADLMPHVLLSEDLLVMGYSKATTNLLADGSPLEVGKPVFSSDSKLASASYIDIGRMFKSFGPWVRYAVKQSGIDLDQELVPQSELPMNGTNITPNDLLGLWSVLESVGEITTTAVSKGKEGIEIRSVYRQSLP
ncbi:MAG: hypothetical protein ACK5PB_08915 [Pirellula sp.]